MSVEDTTMADPVPAESSIDNDQQGPNDGIPEATEPQSSTGDDGVQKETAHSSNQIDQLEEAPAQVEEETTTTDISQIEQVQDQAIGQQGKVFRKAFLTAKIRNMFCVAPFFSA